MHLRAPEMKVIGLQVNFIGSCYRLKTISQCQASALPYDFNKKYPDHGERYDYFPDGSAEKN
jgi:hypothetical protein